MHDERSCCCSDSGVQAEVKKDAEAEMAVLTVVLDNYPEVYTEKELVREVAEDPDELMERDRVDRAIRSLWEVGLLHRCGRPLVFPSRAAMRFWALERDTST